MGRKRIENHDLPKRVYFHHGAYYYFEKGVDGGKTKRKFLGREKFEAMQEYRKIARCGTPGALSELDRLANSMWLSAKVGAKARDIEFKITRGDIANAIQRAAGRCEVSGILFDFTKGKNNKRAWYPSLDRIDASGCYEPGNIRIVCVAVNIALSDFGDDVLMRIAFGITDRFRPVKYFQPIC